MQVGAAGEATAADANGNGNGAPPLAGDGLPSWFGLEGVSTLEDGELTEAAVAGTPLVVANVDGTLLAYRNACADCGTPLGGAALIEGVLACTSAAGAITCRARAARSMTTSFSSTPSRSSGRTARCEWL